MPRAPALLQPLQCMRSFGSTASFSSSARDLPETVGEKRKNPPSLSAEEAPPPPATEAVAVAVDLPGLKAELRRQAQRAFKKAGKASERLLQAQQGEEEEGQGRVDELRAVLQAQQQHLLALEALQEQLQSVKKATSPLLPGLAAAAAALGVGDAPPPRPERPPKRVKAGPVAPRLPYRWVCGCGSVYDGAGGIYGACCALLRDIYKAGTCVTSTNPSPPHTEHTPAPTG